LGNFETMPVTDTLPVKNNRVILIIITHVAVWSCFFALPYLVFFPRLRDFSMSNHQLAAIICNNIFLVLFYYLNTLWLVPRLLVKEKWLWYCLSILICLLIFLNVPRVLANWIAEPELVAIQNREFIRNPAYKGPSMYGPEGRRPYASRYNTVLFLLVFTVGTCISMIQRWLKTEQNRKETEHEKLNTELSFLKSQINPHFFFNTLNNIYSLAVVKSDKTAPAVMKLSKIMRYILTETQHDFVPLSREVEFVHNYIELQQVRLTEMVTVRFQVEGDIESSSITPLLLIPFIENAFKYGVSTKEPSHIHLLLRSNADSISFHAENYIVSTTGSDLEKTGIGINNVKRRLELLYPNRHKLTCETKGQHYIVHLEIKLG
jgi:two-component system LytT family sensor kinase